MDRAEIYIDLLQGICIDLLQGPVELRVFCECSISYMDRAEIVILPQKVAESLEFIVRTLISFHSCLIHGLC